MVDSIRKTPLQETDATDVHVTTDARRKAELNRAVDDDTLEPVTDEAATTAGDVSPHYGGRAQPGDVLGLETGGETTGIGDTAEDENKRRRDAEKNRK
jgi:hypothetical protein